MKQAREFLLQFLANGPKRASEIVDSSPVSRAILGKAKKELKIRTHRTGFGANHKVEWELDSQKIQANFNSTTHVCIQ